MSDHETLPAAVSQPQPPARPAQAPEIDLEHLVEKVYQLMRAEARLDRSRRDA